MKRILRGISMGDLDDAGMRDLIGRCGASGDLKEGLLARREGRDAAFRGS
jgi:hypothetical protein